MKQSLESSLSLPKCLGTPGLKLAAVGECVYFSLIGTYWLVLSLTRWFGVTFSLVAAFVTAAVWFATLFLAGQRRLTAWALARDATCVTSVILAAGFITTLIQLDTLERDLFSWSPSFREGATVVFMIIGAASCVLSVTVAILSYNAVRKL